jgi:hypothetical protein
VAAQHDVSNETLAEELNAPRGAPADSFANMVRTEDTIPRLPRAVAELTRFRVGGLSLFGESFLVSAGLSETDFFIDGACGTLPADSRRGLILSCWLSDDLLLMDPVVLEFASIESLLFFWAREEIRSTTPGWETKYVPLLPTLRLGNPVLQRQSFWASP